MGERTGSRVFQWVWSYVVVLGELRVYVRRMAAYRGSLALLLNSPNHYCLV
ncbi:hypothetical protein CLIM01_09183 [Colletotrichum limetticola]|uniref:Uncharacterized protein n=1 Tax=Colletotrichum limetticola TaxID=1209924 RepID=A0ABQ9PPJ7_9PEZI|nr:hypothetical protein CLIM01_09183 [Colletotrichum limetticola]